MATGTMELELRGLNYPEEEEDEDEDDEDDEKDENGEGV